MKTTAMSEKDVKQKVSYKGMRFLALVLTILMLFSVTACAPNGEKPPAPSESKKSDVKNDQPDETKKKTPDVDQDDVLKKILLAAPGAKLDGVKYDDISASCRAALWGFADKTSRLALGDDADKNALYSRSTSLSVGNA